MASAMMADGTTSMLDTINGTAAMLDTINDTAAMTPVMQTSLLEIIFDEVQFSINLVGIVANLMTLITLGKNGDGFSPTIGLLLKYQSFIDAFDCIMALLIFKLPNVVDTGYYIMDTLCCHLWTTQHIYWCGTFLSVWNLVTLAVERYICVCRPMEYTKVTKSKVWLVFFFFFMLGTVYLLPGVFQVNMHSGRCVNELYFSGSTAATFFLVWVLSAFFTFYVIPSILFVIAYGLIINKFRQRAKTNLGASGTSTVIEQATTELTKTAVVVTVIFVIAYSYVFWLFVLKYSGVIDYTMKSPKQKIGALLATINLVANPFVYASLLPAYRRSFKKTFFFCQQKTP